MAKIRISSRILSMFLFLVVAVALAGCGGTKNVTSSVGDETDYTPTRTVTDSKVVVYDGPSLLHSSDQVGIKVEDKDLFVYDTLVNHGRTFTFTAPETKAPVAIFDFEGQVHVTITVNDVQVTKAVVRPLKYGVEPVVNGNQITFTLSYPANYVVEYNDNSDTAIHLFANPLETNTPDPNNLPDNMVYIGPGVYKADAIPVQSNETIYIAGGAVVYGQIRAEGVQNVTVRGRGIIDGSIYPRTMASEFTVPIEFRKSQNITLEGITFLNPAGWTIASYFNDGFTIDNIKIISARGNGDGISIQSSKNVTVKNSFVRSWDDSLVVKNYDRGTTDHITFENMVIWTDLAQSMEIGYETNGETMNDITFKNITVIHNFHKPAISIHNSDDAKITNVLYQNITIEDAQEVGEDATSPQDDFVIDFQIQYNQAWSSSGGNRGSIDGVTLDNVIITGKPTLVSRIAGFDASHRIDNVTMNNVMFNGVNVKKDADLNLSTNSYASKVNYKTTANVTGAKLELPYLLALKTNDTPQITVVPNITQVGYLVPQFAIKDLPHNYMGAVVTGNFTVSTTHGTSALDWDDLTGAFDSTNNPAVNAIDHNDATAWVGKSWSKDAFGDFATLSVNFGQDEKIGTIRVYGNQDSNIYQLQNIAVYGIRSTSTRDVYTKLLNAKDYEFTPATGNFVDIKINPGEFRALQLRFYHIDGIAYPSAPFASEVEFYPASLTFNKAVNATANEDVYAASNLTDGNPLTYYESQKNNWPAEITIDMAGVYNIRYIDMYLPPLMQWDPRTEEVTIYASIDGNIYQEIVAKNSYTFDPKKGNLVEIKLDNPVSAQYIKFTVTSNSSAGGEGAQFSEISVFE